MVLAQALAAWHAAEYHVQRSEHKHQCLPLSMVTHIYFLGCFVPDFQGCILQVNPGWSQKTTRNTHFLHSTMIRRSRADWRCQALGKVSRSPLWKSIPAAYTRCCLSDSYWFLPCQCLYIGIIPTQSTLPCLILRGPSLDLQRHRPGNNL